MTKPLTPADFLRATRWLSNHVAVLQVRREFEQVDELHRRMATAEAQSTVEARLAALLTIAESEGYRHEEGAA